VQSAAEVGESSNSLRKSDGTEAGTSMVKDLYRGEKSSSPAWIVELEGSVYFVATRPSAGRELWSAPVG